MNIPSYDQIRKIVAAVITDTDPEALEPQDLREITDAVATQISRWHLDTEPAQGSIAHHILDTLAGNDTPTHLIDLLSDSVREDTLTASLDNLLVAGYVLAGTDGYTITARGLRALGSAPTGATVDVSDQGLARDVLKTLRNTTTAPTFQWLIGILDLSGNDAVDALAETVTELVDEGYITRVINPDVITYKLTEAGQSTARDL